MAEVGLNTSEQTTAGFRSTFAWRTDPADREELERLTSWAEGLCRKKIVTLDFADRAFGPNLRLMPFGRDGDSLFQLYNYHDKGRAASGHGIYLYSQSHVRRGWEDFKRHWFSQPYPEELLERVNAAANPGAQGLRIEHPSTAILADIAELLRTAGRVASSNRGRRPRRASQPYQPKDENFQTSVAKTWEHDPDTVDRGTASHRRLQNELARLAAKNGLKPEDRGNIDVAWIDRNTLVVIEVKSTTPQNETKQLRLGLGQVLDYQDVEARGFDSVRAVLAIEQPPSDERWIRLCARHDVELVWRETFSSLFS